MKCLSVQQPWAWAICAGIKTVENRGWSTDYRGPVVIQAGTKKEVLKEQLQKRKPRDVSMESFAFGGLIGIANLVDVVEMNPDLEKNGWALGPFCWIMERGRFFEKPIKSKGKLKLYSLT